MIQLLFFWGKLILNVSYFTIPLFSVSLLFETLWGYMALLSTVITDKVFLVFVLLKRPIVCPILTFISEAFLGSVARFMATIAEATKLSFVLNCINIHWFSPLRGLHRVLECQGDCGQSIKAGAFPIPTNY